MNLSGQSSSQQGQGQFTQEAVINACKESFNFLAALCLPDVCITLFPQMYIYIVQKIFEALQKERDFSQFAIGLPRGHAKTTFLKIFVVMMILFTKKKFILIVCHTGELAENFIRDVAGILDSVNIIRTFGNWRTFQKIDRQDLKAFTFQGREITLGGIGASGTVRGLNVGNARPDVILMDDLQSKEEAESPVVSKKLLVWFTGTLLKAKSPYGCTYIYCGNMYRDLLIDGSAGKVYTCILRNLQLNKNWTSILVGGILADGQALWEEVQPLEQLLRELENDISMGCAEVFFSEVLNDPQCGNGIHFDLSKFPQWNLNETIELCTGKFIMIDPSLGKKKSDAQIVGIGYIYEGIPHVWKLFNKQVSSPELVKFCIVLCLKEGIPLVVGETVGYQGTLLQWFEELIRTGFEFEGEHYPAGIEGISIQAIAPGGRKKTARILSLFKSMMEGKIRIHPSCLSLVLNQIASFDPLKTNNVDDILDTIAYMEEIPVLYPNECIPIALLDSLIMNLKRGTVSGVSNDNHCF